jgi:cytochrome c-type biogenesis protein CcmH
MSFTLSLILALIAAAAVAFVAWPAWRTGDGNWRAGLALAGSLGIFVLAIGGGSYFMLGRPDLAQRSLMPVQDRDYGGLIATLAQDVRKNPNDVRGWLFLGAGYSKLRDPQDAAKAFARAIQTAGPNPPAGLYALYGEALTESSGGEVTDEASAAFDKTIALDPHNMMARYYLGIFHAQRHENDQALALWKSLLADAPKDAPWRGDLLSRIAMLSAGNGMQPNIEAMVSGLDARLKANPNDPQGWQMLIRAYVVLGRTDKAAGALKDARTVLAKNADAMKAIAGEARSLKLEP